MTDFLLELLSEEIPARMQAKARGDLKRLFGEQIAAAGMKAGRVQTFSTPRRLALIARDLPETTEAVSEEIKGPPADAPDAALEGFLRKAGLTRDALEVREVKGRATLFAVINKPGRSTASVLAEAIPAIIRAFPWPKSMRWGAASQTTESLRWVRPLQGIIALLGGDVVPCEIDGLVAGRTTVGHRFHHKGPVNIVGVQDYASALRAAHVIVDHDERARLIRDGAGKAAADAGLVLVEDEGLVIENAGLTEWPVPLLGHFDPAFLEVPPEVIQLTTRINQKYFVVRDASGALAPAFVCTANIAAHDGGKAIIAGNEKVLAARLGDARFFWELDQKKTLAQHGEKLNDIVFHEKLGTVADKVERVAKLARWLVEEGIIKPPPLQGRGKSHAVAKGEGQEPTSAQSPLPPPPSGGSSLSPEGERAKLADLAEQAARLCKADLVTEMVGEFPELQGVMGGYYAAKEGLDPQVAAAIRDHYKPMGLSGDVPSDWLSIAVSLADKLDTLACFFAIGESPTGSKDPFALRRAALGIIALIQQNALRFDVAFAATEASCLLLWQAASENRAFVAEGREPSDQLITAHPESFGDDWTGRDWFVQFGRARDPYYGADDEMAFRGHEGSPYSWKRYNALNKEFSHFFADRLKVQQREAGVRHDLIDAVFALGGEDDLVRLLARVHALQAFVETGEGGNLLAGYKRAANILKKEGFSPLPQGKGQGASALRGEGDAPSFAATSPSHPAAPGGPLPLPEGEGFEAALIEALDAAEPLAVAAIDAEDFEGAMAALAVLRAPIDAFFDHVTVNDADPAKRASRLALLARFRSAVHRVADFSKIEG